MINKYEILARLQKGEDVDAIAAEMTEAINAAQEELIKINAKKLEDQKREAAKQEAAKNMLSAYADYAVASGEEELAQALREVEAEEFIKLLSKCMSFVNKPTVFEHWFF